MTFSNSLSRTPEGRQAGKRVTMGLLETDWDLRDLAEAAPVDL